MEVKVVVQPVLCKSYWDGVKTKGDVFYGMDLLGFYSVTFDTMEQSKHMPNVLGQVTLVQPWFVAPPRSLGGNAS